MRTIQNNPRTYVSRSELNRLPSPLPDRSGKLLPVVRGTRDFVSAEIDRNFYVTFGLVQKTETPK